MREENSISIFNSKSHLFQILRELAELNGTTSNCNGTLARIHLVRTLTLKHLFSHSRDSDSVEFQKKNPMTRVHMEYKINPDMQKNCSKL